jgi:ParB-like nuclease domain
MDDLAIAWRPLGELIPYARNPRTHNDAQVAQIAASIREFGWTNPVLVDGESGIIAGHGRVLAARKLQLERVPVIEVAHMSEAQIRAPSEMVELRHFPRDVSARRSPCQRHVSGKPVPREVSCTSHGFGPGGRTHPGQSTFRLICII